MYIYVYMYMYYMCVYSYVYYIDIFICNWFWVVLIGAVLVSVCTGWCTKMKTMGTAVGNMMKQIMVISHMRES